VFNFHESVNCARPWARRLCPEARGWTAYWESETLTGSALAVLKPTEDGIAPYVPRLLRQAMSLAASKAFFWLAPYLNTPWTASVALPPWHCRNSY
jgi:hypothetical protein